MQTSQSNGLSSSFKMAAMLLIGQMVHIAVLVLETARDGRAKSWSETDEPLSYGISFKF